jgi:hypothetical protein
MKTGVRIAVVAATAAMAAAGVAGPAMAAQQTPGKTIIALAKKTKHIKCNAHQAHAAPYVSVSWVYPQSNISTTVYFNNHCTAKKHLQTWRVDGSGAKLKGKCLTVNAKTHGKKKITDPGFSIYNITTVSHC